VYVDLDRTLIRRSTSTLELRDFIIVNGFVSTILIVFNYKLFSKLKLKTWISKQPNNVDYSSEFNPDVISLTQEFKSKGSPVILATASPRISAERVISQCPVTFNELITSSDTKNIKGLKKLAEIQKSLEFYKTSEFVYIGDSIADLKIMKSSAKSYFVGKKLVLLIGRVIYQIRQLNGLHELNRLDKER
jgi:phosphoserine phosphatase